MLENIPSSRDTNPNTATDAVALEQVEAEKVPHSHKHGERPVHDFDSTPLKDAIEQGKLHGVTTDAEGNPTVTVESLADHTDPTSSRQTDAYAPLTTHAPETAPTVEAPKKKRGLLIGLGSAAAGIAATAGAFFAFGGHSSDAAPQPEQAVSASANPGSGTETGSETTGEKQPSTQPEQTQNPATGVELSGVTKLPSEEQLNYVASHPVLVEGGTPTAEGAKAAEVMLADYMNIFRNSGKIDANGFNLSAESKAVGDSILDNVYGPAGVRNPNLDLSHIESERESIAAAFEITPGLESNSRVEPSAEPAAETIVDGKPVWQVDVTEIHTGTWDQTESPERNDDFVGKAYLAIYDSPEGLAWYYYKGDLTQTPSDLS